MVCEGCGAALPVGKPGEAISCAYCGRERRVPGAPAPKPAPAPAAPRPAPAAPRAQRRRPGGKGNPAYVVLALLAVVGGFVFWWTTQRRGTGRLGPEDMDRAPEMKWVNVSLSGLKGSRKHFDAIANYEWALALARGWSPDVVPERIELDHVRHDGVGPDVTDRRTIHNARYRFTSPSRAEAAAKMAEVSDKRLVTGVTIWLSGNYVRAMVDTTRPSQETPPGPTLSCSMADVLAAARTSDRLPKRPFYRVWLRTYGTPARWVWSVDAGRSAKVDAQSCALVGH